jgi:hypothetical protein
LFSLPDANIIVPGRNYTALVDLGEIMKGLDVGYGVLVTGLTSAGAGSINNSTGVDGVVGVKSCAKRKRNFSQLLLPWPAVIRSGQNHIGCLFKRAARGIRQQRL